MTESASADFKCLQCGNCCTVSGSVALRPEDMERIAHYLDLSAEEFTSQYTELNLTRTGLRLKDHDDGSCVFLSADRSCKINEVKPKQCCGFPIYWNYMDWKKVCSFNYPAAV